MPGFTSLNDVINALSVNGLGESGIVNKTSITTVAGGKYALGYAAGIPTPLVFGTALTATAMDNTVAGAILPFTNPTAPATKHLINAGLGSTVAAGTFLIYDLLARYPVSGAVITSQTFTSVTLPARDLNGATAGAGVQMMVVNANATATTATTLTVNYTNSAGTAARSTAQAIIASAQYRILHDTQGFFMPLQAGDTGVQTIQSCQFTATATSTQIEIQLVRPLIYIPVLVAGGYTERNMVTELVKLRRLYNGTALQVALLAGTTTSGNVIGDLGYASN